MKVRCFHLTLDIDDLFENKDVKRWMCAYTHVCIHTYVYMHIHLHT